MNTGNQAGNPYRYYHSANPMLRALATILTALAIVYLGVCLILFVFQRSLIYFPPREAVFRSIENTMTLRVPGAELKLTSRPLDGRAAVLYFGGNAEDVSMNLPQLVDAFPGHALYLLHYRGYGGSTGEPSEDALHADALAVFDRVRAAHPDVVVMGRSLGAAVAIRLASMRPVARLILVTPFDSILDLAERQFPFLPVRWLLMDKFETEPYAARVRVPTTLIVAEHDEIVPRASVRRLLSRFPEGVADMQVIRGTRHNTISQSRAYVPALKHVPSRKETAGS